MCAIVGHPTRRRLLCLKWRAISVTRVEDRLVGALPLILATVFAALSKRQMTNAASMDASSGTINVAT
jgi:hypothetical protein